MSDPKKSKKRRDKVPNAALVKRYNTRIRQEYIDIDYEDKLNAEEKAWLNKFMENWNNNSYSHDGTDIESYEQYGKESNDRSNARRRCLYGILKNKANKLNNKRLLNYDNLTSEIESELSKDLSPNHLEDAYIDYIEHKEIEEMMREYAAAMVVFSEDV